MGQRFSQARVIEAIVASKGLVTIAARGLSCDPQTIRNYGKRYPKVAEALREEREKLLDVGELSLYRQVQEGEGWAVCFLLKTLGKDRGYVEKAEQDNRGDITVRVEYVDYPNAEDS